MKRGRRRLVQFRLGLADSRESHRRVARLEENLPILEMLAGDEMFEIQTRDARHKEASRALRVMQAPHTVVAGAMFVSRGVVAHDPAVKSPA